MINESSDSDLGTNFVGNLGCSNFELFIFEIEQTNFGKAALNSTYSVQLSSTISMTFFSYSRRFSWNNWAAFELAGEFGFGSSNRD